VKIKNPVIVSGRGRGASSWAPVSNPQRREDHWSALFIAV